MYKGYRYFDSDAHVLEPSDMWERYLEPKFRSQMPDSICRYMGDPLGFRVRILVGQYGMPGSREGNTSLTPGLGEAYQQYALKGFEPDCYRDAMDRTGIDCMVVYPTVSLYVCTVPELPAETGAAYRRAYNNWLRDFTVACGGRVLGAGAVDLRDPQEAAREARRCVRDLGLKAIMINPEPVTQHRLNDPFYDPLWSEIEDLDVPLAIHVTAGNAAEVWVQHYFPTLQRAKSPSTFTIGNMLTSITLIIGGVLERHPRLRVVHLESGAGWAAFWPDRMEASVGGGFRNLKIAGLSMKPIEYFKRQCYVSADPDDPGMTQVIQTLGDDNLVTATDFGHPEGREYISAIQKTLALSDIPDATKRKIMWDNAVKLYNVKTA